MLRSVLTRADWPRFTHSLQPTTQSVTDVDIHMASAIVGLQPLRSVWQELADAPALGTVAEFHRGLEWKGDQARASRIREQKGFRPGLHRIAGSLTQFPIGTPVYLDCRLSELRGGAIH